MYSHKQQQGLTTEPTKQNKKALQSEDAKSIVNFRLQKGPSFFLCTSILCLLRRHCLHHVCGDEKAPRGIF